MTNEKMKVWAYFKHNAGDFSRHWGAYIMLISVTNLFIGLAVIPFLILLLSKRCELVTCLTLP